MHKTTYWIILIMKKKKIVLIDDKISIAKVISIYLSKEYEFAYFENPLDAIDKLEAGDIPDLIISDIRMPKMTGDDFLQYMKTNQRFKSIPIIILSGEDSTTERIKLLEKGASDFIVKPFNPQELKVRIKKIID